MKDNYLKGSEALDKVIVGADKVADVVKMTLGAAGANYISEHTLFPYYITSNDGIQLAKAMKLEDPFEQLGANLMQEIASRADKASDGTTTAITLAQAIIHEGRKVDAQPMEIKRSLEECIPIIESALKDQAKEIDVSEVGNVATISAEDESIGLMIQEIYQHIGRDGIIFNDASRDYKDSYTLDKGVHISDCGYASPYMGDINEQGQMLSSVEIKNPLIVITKQKINSIKDLESIGSIVISEGKKDLVIFADEFEGQALNDLILTRAKTGLRTALFKLPILWKDWWIEDIAKLTGATIVDPANGILLKDFTRSMFGTCNTVIASGKTENSPGDCFLDGTLDVTDYIEELKKTGQDDMALRAARLNKKTAKYHVGALTEQALKYRKDKVVDALGSAYQALHGGIVAGGGVALREAAKKISTIDSKGAKILSKSLIAPITQISENGGFPYKDMEFPYGLDVKSGNSVEMFEAGIVDAYSTVLNSLKAAVSVAATILTAKVVTILDKTPDKQLDPFRPYEH